MMQRSELNQVQYSFKLSKIKCDSNYVKSFGLIFQA